MDERQVLPEGLAYMPPGPGLAAVLGSIDRTRLVGADLCILLKSRARQVAYEQAQLLADMLETAYTPGEGDTLDRTRSLDEFSGDQVAFELRWSRSAVAGHLGVAQDLIERLPVVYQSLTAGRIDLVRARAFSEALALLDDEKARLIAARLIDRAQTWTVGQLRERLRYHVLKADPDAAKARYQFRVADRRVYNQPYTDGTSELSGINLPPDRAAAAFDRIERLAQAAKSDGDARTLPQLRADAFLDLLAGRVFQLRPGTDPLTEAADQASRDADIGVNDATGDTTQPKPRRRSGTRPGRGFTARTARTTPTPTAGSGSVIMDSLRRSARAATNPTEPGPTEPGPTTPGPTEPGPTPTGAAPDRDPSEGLDPRPDPGRDDDLDPAENLEPPEDHDPGEDFVACDDYDPIGTASLGTASLGTASLGSASLGGDDPPPAANPNDNPVPDDLRMCSCGGVRPAPRLGVVDLQVKLSTLMCLDEDPGMIPGWGPVIADIARHVAHDQEHNPTWRWSITDENGNLLHHGHTRRRPTAAEKAFVKARDRTCRAPGCRRPAMRCDDDHRQEYANAGPSHRGNLCVLCRHHHRLRHEKGFVVHQISAGTYLWEAPNGRQYAVLPDGTLILTAEDLEPPPPPGYVSSLIPDDALIDDDLDADELEGADLTHALRHTG